MNFSRLVLWLIKISKVISEILHGIARAQANKVSSLQEGFYAGRPVIFIDFHDRGLEHFYPCLFATLRQGGATLVFSKRNIRFLGNNSGSYRRFWQKYTFEILNFDDALLKYHRLIYLWDTICPVPEKLRIRVQCVHLNTDYFTGLYNKKRSSGFILPIGAHPNFYFGGSSLSLVREKATESERFIGAFFSGNVARESYDSVNLRRIFSVPSRWESISTLENQCADFVFYPPDGQLDINRLENRILLDKLALNTWGEKKAKSSGSPLSESDWTSCILGSEFFLALPGCEVPYTWSLTEAMCAGAIPILHRSYADLLSPKLEDSVNCITFQFVDELLSQIRFALSLPVERKSQLRINVLSYYDVHLSPVSILEKLVSIPDDAYELFMMTETRSVMAFERNELSN
jgi:hypothetical protein